MTDADRLTPDTPATLTLNGQAMPWPAGCRALSACTGGQVVRLSGGLLLKAALGPDTLHLRVEPNFIDGQRVYHYGMTLPAGLGPVVTGQVSPVGAVALLFAPAEPDPLRRTCRLLARALRDSGLPAGAPLEPVTQQALREVGAFATPPATLGELAESV